MTSKRLIAMIFALVVTFSISGCGINISKTTDTENNNSFTQIFSGKIEGSRFYQYVMCDDETNVLYMYTWDYVSGGSTTTVLYNYDGSLRTLDNNTEIKSLVMVKSWKVPNSRYYQYMMYDPYTLVMYLFSWDYISSGSTVSVMYNADGSIKTYDLSAKDCYLEKIDSKEIHDSRYIQTVMYDIDTNVMYLYFWDYISGGSTVTVLYELNGTPRLYEESISENFLCGVDYDESSNSRYIQAFMYDPYTLVMYMFTWDNISGSSTITAMYDEYGLPKKYLDDNSIVSMSTLYSGKILDSHYTYVIRYDPETLVQYLYSWDYKSGSSTVTVLYNSDGSLKLNSK